MEQVVIGITGSNGVLGKLITLNLVFKQAKFTCFDGDIRDANAIKVWLSKNEVTHIVHLASKVAINEVNDEKELAYDVNVGGTIQLMKAIKELSKPVFLFYASSSHVYQSKESKITEEDELNPLNTYGMTKYLSEKILLDLTSDHHLTLCIGRIFSFFHSSQKPPFLFPTIKQRLEKEDLAKPFYLYGANSTRDFLNAEEVADYIVKLTLGNAKGLFNIGSGKGIKISDFVQSISSEDLKIHSYENDTPNYLVADASKLKIFLNEK